MNKQCLRCGDNKEADQIGQALVNYVCWDCRHDASEWDFSKRLGGVAYTLKAMVNELPEKIYTDVQNGEGRS